MYGSFGLVLFWFVSISSLQAFGSNQLLYQQWHQRFDGSGKVDDFAEALAVSTTGNVCVTGRSMGAGTDYDCRTVMYGADGNIIWSAGYDYQFRRDQADAVAIDKLGNVFICGSSCSDSDYDYDFITIKYSPSGTMLWCNRYNGPANGPDQAFALALDSLGNAVVTGFASDVSGADFCTIKYDPNGKLLWCARYDGLAHRDDNAIAVVTDRFDCIYVTGPSTSPNGCSDIVTVKYSPSGQQLWAASYDGPDHLSDTGIAIALDGIGNVFVAGTSISLAGWEDFITIKYDPNGTMLWSRRADGPVNDTDNLTSLSVTPDGFACVTGSSLSTASFDYLSIKYDPNGTELWRARYDGPANSHDFAWANALDSSGKLYVTGSSCGLGTSRDFCTVKYDSYGNMLAVSRYNGPNSITDSAKDIAVSPSGVVYVTGYSEFDYLTLKYLSAICTAPLNSDYNNDCTISFSDLAALLSRYLETRPGGTDLSDFARLASQWLRSNLEFEFMPTANP